MNESKPIEHIMNEAMPPFPMKRATHDPKSTYDPETSSHGRMYQKIFGMKASMFDNIKPGDFVQTKSWLPVTGVDGDSITIDDSFTTGRESIVGHKPKERTPDEIWASWSDEQKRQVVEQYQW